MGCKGGRGVTLLEVLVVMGTISLLAAILLPVVARVRGEARQLLCLANLRQIALGVTNYASDSDNSYPESVATIGFGSGWNWQAPTMMTACFSRSFPGQKYRRSMSAYLGDYIADASIMFCPSAPTRYEYLQEAWDAGDSWNNPDTDPNVLDPVYGTYCFYWNYLGILEVGPSLEGERWFRGPRELCGGRGQSELLVSDYFGYDHRDKNAYGSCEPLRGACITGGSNVSSDYWSVLKQDENMGPDTFGVKLHASYADGHAGSYSPSQTVPMWVSMTSDGSQAYNVWGDLDPGIYYLPENGTH